MARATAPTRPARAASGRGSAGALRAAPPRLGEALGRVDRWIERAIHDASDGLAIACNTAPARSRSPSVVDTSSPRSSLPALPPAPPSLAPGLCLGGYELLERVGRGGMAE